MTELVFKGQQGDKAEHGHASIELFGMGVEAIPRQLAFGDQCGIKHDRDTWDKSVWGGGSHWREG